MNKIQIGYTQKVHGVRGEIKVHIEKPYQNDALKASVFFIELPEGTLPYFIEQLQFGKTTIAKFEEVNDKETAKKLSGKNLFLKEEDVTAKEQREFELDYKFFEGFLIKDIELGTIGTIEEIVEMPHQIMAFLSYQNREVLIPINEYFIQDIDLESEVILMELPDGLLDVYTA